MRGPRPASLLAVCAVCAVALTASACSGGNPSGTTVDAGGTTIPAAATTTTETRQVVTTPSGAPKVVQFAAPRHYWCLLVHKRQAQVSVGWSVPSATDVAVLLDGAPLHTGIRKALPFWVPAGKADGIGGTIVFPCRPQSRHRITIQWRMKGSPMETRTVTIRKAASS